MDQENRANGTGLNRKRARLDSDDDSSESKLVRVNSSNLERILSDPEQNRSDSDELGANHINSVHSGINSPEAKRIQDDLLNIWDDSDEPSIQGLESVIKSFEIEIFHAPADEMTSHSGLSQPELGYLFEASDDELGLPPTVAAGEENKIVCDDFAVSGEAGVGDFVGENILEFETAIPNYDSFEFGLSHESDGNYNDGADFVALGGLFDHSEENFVPANISGLQWQPESLSAL